MKVLGSLEHPNIVSYRESFVERRKLCIVMGFADGGDLNDLISEKKRY